MSFDAIGIVSEDPARSIAFYKLLGVEIVRYADSDHYEATLANGTRLMLDSVALIKSYEPSFEKQQGTGIALCFKLDSAAAVDATYAAITAAGHRSVKAPWDAFWGHRYACVRDPDGTQIDLFAHL